jgi:hypothetical protein
MDNPEPTEEEQEQSQERQQEEDDMRYPAHGDPDKEREGTALDDE